MFRETAEDEAEEQDRDDGHDREAPGRAVVWLGEAGDEGVGAAEQGFEEALEVEFFRERGFERRWLGGVGNFVQVHGRGVVWWFLWMAWRIGVSKKTRMTQSAGRPWPPLVLSMAFQTVS